MCRAGTLQTAAIRGVAALPPAGQVTETNNPQVALYIMQHDNHAFTTKEVPANMQLNVNTTTTAEDASAKGSNC